MEQLDNTTVHGFVLPLGITNESLGLHTFTTTFVIGSGHKFKLMYRSTSSDEMSVMLKRLEDQAGSEAAAPCGLSLNNQSKELEVTCEMLITGDGVASGSLGVRKPITYCTRASSVSMPVDKALVWRSVCSKADLLKGQVEGRTITLTVRMAVLPIKQLARVEMSDVALVHSAAPASALGQLSLEDESFSDCSVGAADGGSFKCHRVVLAAASAVMGAAFSGGLGEAKQQELVIKDTTTDVLRLLLQHIYGTASLKVPLLLLLPLLRLADMYGLDGLHADLTAWLNAAQLSEEAVAAMFPQAVNCAAIGPAGMLAVHMISVLGMADDSKTAALIGNWRLCDIAKLLVVSGGKFAAFKAAVCWVEQAAADKEEEELSTAEAAAAEAAAAAAADGSAAEFRQAAWGALLCLVDFCAFSSSQLAEARNMRGADSIPGLERCLLDAFVKKARRS